MQQQWARQGKQKLKRENKERGWLHSCSGGTGVSSGGGGVVAAAAGGGGGVVRGSRGGWNWRKVYSSSCVGPDLWCRVIDVEECSDNDDRKSESEKGNRF